MLLAALAGYFELIKGCMFLAVAAQLVRAGIGMVMALKDDVDLIGVKNRRELRAEQDAVRIGMVFAAAVNILVHDDDAPFRIRMGFDGLFDQGLMVGGVVVVGVDDDEQRAAVGIVVTVAGFSRIRFFRKGIWDVEVILIA